MQQKLWFILSFENPKFSSLKTSSPSTFPLLVFIFLHVMITVAMNSMELHIWRYLGDNNPNKEGLERKQTLKWSYTPSNSSSGYFLPQKYGDWIYEPICGIITRSWWPQGCWAPRAFFPCRASLILFHDWQLIFVL